MSNRLEGNSYQTARMARVETDLPFRPSILGQRSPRSGSSKLKTLSPNKQQLLHTARHPLILRKQKDNTLGGHLSSRSKGQCVNHPNREAEFKSLFQGKQQLFCERCAAQLASQGCNVQRVGVERSLKRVLGNRFEYPRSMQITEFLEQLRVVEKVLRANNGQLSTLEEHYRLKLECLDEFYANILEYIQQLKRQHLSLLKQDLSRNLQIASIELKQNQDNLLEMASITHDIESQLDAIVNAIPEEQFRKCLSEYNRSLEGYRHAAAGQQTFIHNTTDSEIEVLRGKLVEFRTTVEHIIGKEDSGLRAVAGGLFSFDGSINNPQKSAFRGLFESNGQESDPALPNQSPQFKAL